MSTRPFIPISKIELVPCVDLKQNPRNARTHPKRQIKLIADSVRAFGFVNPVLIDETGTLIAGEARLAAAKELGMTEVPTIRIGHLSDDKKRALMLADNQLGARSGWNPEILAIEIQHLSEIVVDFDVTVTGFEPPQIDLILKKPVGSSAEDALAPIDRSKPAVTRPGDLWRLGPHAIFCGDARELATYRALMHGGVAKVTFADAPYNVKIAGHVSQSTRLAHREFAMGVGEMSEADFIGFLQAAIACSSSFSSPGAVHYWSMDWRHQLELMTAMRAVGLEHLNTCVWVKDNGGMGGMYRSQHEFIGVFKVPGAPHRNNVELGKHGRNRTNVWKYPGATTLSRSGDEGRLNELHPTIKPVALVADALLDCSARGEIVLDPFLGSGSTLIAAERVGRVCRAIDLDALYVDTAIERWQRLTGEKAAHAETGVRFDDAKLEVEAHDD